MLTAREVAAHALVRVESDGAYSNIVLNNALKKSELNNTDKAFAGMLFYGVLERKLTLDYILDSLTKTPVKKTDKYVLQVMRVALYQIMYMDRVPVSAAVNEAVKSVKKSPKRALSGFVNAVLRKAQSAQKIIPQGLDAKSLSIRYSCNEDIVRELVNDYGEQTAQAFLENALRVPPVTLRVNTQRTTPQELSREIADCGVDNEIEENAVILKGGMDIENCPQYKSGLFHVQDLSSQRAIKTLNVSKGERVLDMCASPGGKSFTMAESADNAAQILSCDLSDNRVSLIVSGCERLGLDSISTVVQDATVYNESLGKFDKILCDVPCSGFGIIRRKPDIKYKECGDFTLLEETQQKILCNAVNYLNEKGSILYSTCTLRKSENEKQVEKFIKAHTDFGIEYMHTYMPHTDNTDGFFAALLVRR